MTIFSQMKPNLYQRHARMAKNPPFKVSALSRLTLHQQRFERDGRKIHRADIQAHLLSEIHDLVPVMKISHEMPFFVEKLLNGHAKVRCSGVGQKLLEIAKADFVKLLEDYPAHKFSPFNRRFIKFSTLVPTAANDAKMYFNCELPLKLAKLVVKNASRLALAFRKRLSGPAIKTAQESFGRSANDNFKRLLQVVEWIAQKHTEVVILRYDTHVREQNARPYKSGDAPRLSHLDHYLACRKRFHRWLSARFGDDLLLYAWTLEYGHESAFHHHYVVILKPRGNEDHIAVVEEIGRKWKAITEDMGWIHNCNEHWRDYPYRALGLVRSDNPEVIKGLHFIAAYLTLAGVYVKLDLPKRIGAFDMGGKYPKKAPIPKAGRRPLKQPLVPIAITAAEGRARFVNFL